MVGVALEGPAGVVEAATPRAGLVMLREGVLLPTSALASTAVVPPGKGNGVESSGAGIKGVIIEFRMCMGPTLLKTVGPSPVDLEATVLEEVVLNDKPDTSITANATTATAGTAGARRADPAFVTGLLVGLFFFLSNSAKLCALCGLIRCRYERRSANGFGWNKCFAYRAPSRAGLEDSNEVCASDSTGGTILVVVEVTVRFTANVRVLFTKIVVVPLCSSSPKTSPVPLLLDAEVAFGEMPMTDDVGSGSRTPRFDVYIVPSDTQVEIRKDRP